MVRVHLDQRLYQRQHLLGDALIIDGCKDFEEVFTVDDAFIDLLIILLELGQHLVDLVADALLQPVEAHGVDQSAHFHAHLRLLVDQLRDLLLAFVLLGLLEVATALVVLAWLLRPVFFKLLAARGRLLLHVARGRWTEVRHQSLQVHKFDGVAEFGLAEDAHEAVDLDLVELLDADLVAARDEVVGRHDLDVLLALELRQVVDDVLPSKRLPHCQAVHAETLGDHVEDGFGDVEHLLFADFDLVLPIFLLLLVVIVLVVIAFIVFLLLLLLQLLVLLFIVFLVFLIVVGSFVLLLLLLAFDFVLLIA